MQVTRKGTILKYQAFSQKVGDQAKEFELKSLDDKSLSLG